MALVVVGGVREQKLCELSGRDLPVLGLLAEGRGEEECRQVAELPALNVLASHDPVVELHESGLHLATPPESGRVEDDLFHVARWQGATDVDGFSGHGDGVEGAGVEDLDVFVSDRETHGELLVTH